VLEVLLWTLAVPTVLRTYGRLEHSRVLGIEEPTNEKRRLYERVGAMHRDVMAMGSSTFFVDLRKGPEPQRAAKPALIGPIAIHHHVFVRLLLSPICTFQIRRSGTSTEEQYKNTHSGLWPTKSSKMVLPRGDRHVILIHKVNHHDI
jgi:hypothetical protein